jgi:hypothetical protein
LTDIERTPVTSTSSTTGDLDRADVVDDLDRADVDDVDDVDDFTDIEIAELQEEQPDGPSFTAPAEPVQPTPAAIAAAPGPAESVERFAVAGASAELSEAQAVAATLRALGASVGGLDSADLLEHVDFYQQAHGQLQQALRDIDHA